MTKGTIWSGIEEEIKSYIEAEDQMVTEIRCMLWK